MLEQVGFKVDLQVLDPGAYNQKTDLSHLDQPAEQQHGILRCGRFLIAPIFRCYSSIIISRSMVPTIGSASSRNSASSMRRS